MAVISFKNPVLHISDAIYVQQFMWKKSSQNVYINFQHIHNAWEFTLCFFNCHVTTRITKPFRWKSIAILESIIYVPLKHDRTRSAMLVDIYLLRNKFIMCFLSFPIISKQLDKYHWNKIDTERMLIWTVRKNVWMFLLHSTKSILIQVVLNGHN